MEQDDQPIDWQKVRQRLARAAAATERALELSPDQAKAVMDERARQLARVTPELPSAAEAIEVVTFSLDNERYGIEARYVHEVTQFSELTPVPDTPDFLLGVTNRRGDVLAVIDLCRLFGLTAIDLTDSPRLIVLGEDQAEFGILANGAQEMSLLHRDAVLEPPGVLTGIDRAYLVGVTKDALILLDGKALMTDARLFIDQSEGQ